MNVRAVARPVQIEAGLRRRHFTRRMRPALPAEDRSGDRALVGAEVADPWMHPERGLILPTDFVAIAEDSGLIVPSVKWVIREAVARRGTGWIRGVSSGVAVNISAVEFRDPRFVDNLPVRCARHGSAQLSQLD